MMPIVNVKLLEGRSDEQLKNLVSEVTDAVEKTTGANRQAIHVVKIGRASCRERV